MIPSSNIIDDEGLGRARMTQSSADAFEILKPTNNTKAKYVKYLDLRLYVNKLKQNKTLQECTAPSIKHTTHHLCQSLE